MWGIIPAAGVGSRIQPLAFSKELLPVGSHFDGSRERPIAVSEYLVERMIIAGASKICFVSSPGKSYILVSYGDRVSTSNVCYTVQAQPSGLCDAIFRALPFVEHEPVLIGLPDTVWFPEDGFCFLDDDILSFLLFPVEHPERFDAVVTNEKNEVLEVRVKSVEASTKWIWGALKMPGAILTELHDLWTGRRDEYLGTLINEYLAHGGRAYGFQTGTSYVDVGTLNGYREALRLVDTHCATELPSL